MRIRKVRNRKMITYLIYSLISTAFLRTEVNLH